ncbi:MAG: flagellar motor protein MotA [Spirochaetes bacterium GWC1_27_15]|nr:MAG: flagellar motor protein MotA [Spirochaetes bacterium GWB1_27_13]OHD25850.1 MAG: flagellar motor protein MotA [Spirochaetes bacterium GWC1_27_15]
MNAFANLFKLFVDGGPIIMSLILICLLVATFIIIERFLYLNRIKINDEKVIDRLSSAIKKGNYDEALAICENAPSPVTNLMVAGIKYKEESEHQIQEAIKDAASLEIPKLEKYLTTLGTIANISTLLGLLGTVQGNMEAFGIIGAKSALGSMEMLATGISKALITTAFGLIVSIPATIFYNHLTNNVNNIILKLETQANELMSILKKGKKVQIKE